MKATTSVLSSTLSNCPVSHLSRLGSHSLIAPKFINFSLGSSPKGVRLKKSTSRLIIIKAVNEEDAFSRSPSPSPSPPSSPSRDGKPRLERLPSGKKVYEDEHDVITFLDSSRDLISLDDPSYNPAQWLWQKIAEIPEKRRQRLLYLLNRRLIRAAWDIAVARYNLPELAELSSSSLLLEENDTDTIEFWSCRKSGGGAMPFALVRNLKKALFRKGGNVYGRLFGTSLLGQVATIFKPLYFTVKDVKCVVPTEEPCDLAYDFGDGILDLDDYPEGFPKPAKHPWPFKDQAVIYVRHIGPGLMIGQAWQEGRDPEQVPEKLCNEILMVKDI